MGARGPAAWEFPEVVQIIDENGIPETPQLFHDWFEDKLQCGTSLRSMAKLLKIPHATFIRAVRRDAKCLELRDSIKKIWGDLILEKTVETVLADKPCHPALTIFLLKALTKLTDQPQHKPKENEPKPQTLVPSMTKDQAKKLIEKIRAKEADVSKTA